MSFGDGLLDRGVILSFTAHEPRLNIEQGHDGPGLRTISMQLKLERGADVLLPGKRLLKEVPWSMLLQERVDVVSAPEKEEPIGILSYLEEMSEDFNFSPEGCHIEAVINREIFNALLSAIRAGRLPDRVSVPVRGLKYGSDPDGLEKIWNVKALEDAPVMNVSFGIGMIASNTSEDSSSSDSIGHLPASSADIRKLSYHRPNRPTDGHSLESAWLPIGCFICYCGYFGIRRLMVRAIIAIV